MSRATIRIRHELQIGSFICFLLFWVVIKTGIQKDKKSNPIFRSIPSFSIVVNLGICVEEPEKSAPACPVCASAIMGASEIFLSRAPVLAAGAGKAVGEDSAFEIAAESLLCRRRDCGSGAVIVKRQPGRQMSLHGAVFAPTDTCRALSKQCSGAVCDCRVVPAGLPVRMPARSKYDLFSSPVIYVSWDDARAMTGSLLQVSRDFMRHRHAGNPLQAWLAALLHKPVFVQGADTFLLCRRFMNANLLVSPARKVTSKLWRALTQRNAKPWANDVVTEKDVIQSA